MSSLSSLGFLRSVPSEPDGADGSSSEESSLLRFAPDIVRKSFCIFFWASWAAINWLISPPWRHPPLLLLLLLFPYLPLIVSNSEKTTSRAGATSQRFLTGREEPLQLTAT